MPSSQSAIPVIPATYDRGSEPPPPSTWIHRKDSRIETLAEVRSLDEHRELSSTLSKRATASRMIDALVERGVDTFFGIPGGPVCSVFEALRIHPRAKLIESRHESHAAFAAAAYHRATGKTAAVVLTAGPGVTNAITGITSASLEAVPLLVIAGDVAWTSHGGRLAQNSGPEGIHIEQMLASVTRRQIRITNARSAIGQTMSALDAATDPLSTGPALVVLPIDVANQEHDDVPILAALSRKTVAAPASAVETAARWLSEASRPLVVLGAGCLGHAAWVRQLVDALDIPFVTTPRAKGVVSETHPRSLRNGGMAASLWARKYTAEPVDVALVLGSDLDDTSVGPTPYVGRGGRLIHVDIDPRVFNRNLPTQLGITADLRHFCNDLYELVARRGYFNGRGRVLMTQVKSESPYDVPGYAQDRSATIAPHRAIADLQKALPDARFVTDIGEHMLFALHYVTAKAPGDFHIQLNLGSMGSGIAGAIGLGMADPSRPVVCICGDGGMQMSGMEVLTAQTQGLPIVYAVFNDSRYNMVHHGMKQIFGRAAPYESPSIDFAAWASSMGIPARIVRRPAQITERLIRELMSGRGPAVLDIRIDREVRLRGGGRVEALQHMSMLAGSRSEEQE